MAELFLKRERRAPPEKERGQPSDRRFLHSEVDPGHPLDSTTLAGMKSRFNYDFGSVRVHDGPEAAVSAKAMNALAYTVGNNIFFGEGVYSPGTLGGQRVIAHELTHVVQQSSGRMAADIGEQPSSLSEVEAIRAENAVFHQESMPAVSRTGVAVMKLPTKDSVVAAIKKLIDTKYGGDYKKAFDHYAKDGAVDKNGVRQLVIDAGYGGTFDPTSTIVDKIMEAVDANKDGKITWEEFSAVLHK